MGVLEAWEGLKGDVLMLRDVKVEEKIEKKMKMEINKMKEFVSELLVEGRCILVEQKGDRERAWQTKNNPMGTRQQGEASSGNSGIR